MSLHYKSIARLPLGEKLLGVSRIIKKTSTPFSVMRMGSTKKVCEGSFL